jgi:ubiquilin
MRLMEDPGFMRAMGEAMDDHTLFSGLAGGAGGFGATPPPPADTRPPEERYADQLRQLNDMGFYEFERNVTALRRSGGSVQGAVEYLLTSPPTGDS